MLHLAFRSSESLAVISDPGGVTVGGVAIAATCEQWPEESPRVC